MSVDPEITIKEIEKKNETPLTEKEKEVIRSIAAMMNTIWNTPNTNKEAENNG